MYGWFFDAHISQHPKHELMGHLMFDEMKLKNDLYWNCSDNRLVGLAGTQDACDRLFAEDEILGLFQESDKKSDTTESVYLYRPASYVNLWRLRTTKNVTHSAEFFFNAGSLTGDELIRQFMRVLGHYELVGVKIIGLLCDAAGQNERMFTLLRGSAKI